MRREVDHRARVIYGLVLLAMAVAIVAYSSDALQALLGVL